MFKHIVFATDGSPSAAKASQTAIELARTNGAKLTVVFVIDPYPYMSLGEGTGDAFQAYMNAAYAASAKVTEDLVEQAKKAGVTMEKSVVEGDDVASAIVMVAEQQGGDATGPQDAALHVTHGRQCQGQRLPGHHVPVGAQG